MQPRMKQPAMLVPEALQAMLALGKSTQNCGVTERLLEMVRLRASQINGCSLCADMHAKSRSVAAKPTNGCTPSRRGRMRRFSPMPNAPRWP